MPVMKRIAFVIGGLGLVAVWVGETVAWRHVHTQYQQTVAARRKLELEVGELRVEKSRLATVVSTAQDQIERLSTTLSARDNELHDTMMRLSQEDLIIQELKGRLLAMQNQMDRLEGELALSLQARETAVSKSDADKTVQLEKVVVTHPASSGPGLQGRVISVNSQWRFVVIDLGWDAVNIGDVVSIYRDNQLLAKARIERVQEQVCAASLMSDGEVRVQINDVVRAL